MNWNQNDNKNQRGPIDRVFISQTEYYEVQHFVDHYLKQRNVPITHENRQVVRQTIATYPGRVPVLRNDLTAYLNKHITVR